MSKKKRQHFVSRFYLRLFSNKSDNKTIGIYNLERGKYIENVSLRDQAYKNYYYDKGSKIEGNLSKIETGASKIIKNITRKYCKIGI